MENTESAPSHRTGRRGVSQLKGLTTRAGTSFSFLLALFARLRSCQGGAKWERDRMRIQSTGIFIFGEPENAVVIVMLLYMRDTES